MSGFFRQVSLATTLGWSGQLPPVMGLESCNVAQSSPFSIHLIPGLFHSMTHLPDFDLHLSFRCLPMAPAGGNGDPLQYLCLGNPMDRGV